MRRKVSYSIFIAVVLVSAVYLSFLFEEGDHIVRTVSNLGYAGLFFASVLSGFNVLIPIPLIVFMPVFLASGFSFWPSLVLITVGMTTGDMLGFAVGHAGRKITLPEKERSRFARWVVSFSEKYPRSAYLILFFYATFAPAPNEVLVVPMAFLGYKFKYIVPIVLLGNFVFNTLVSFGILRAVSLF